MQCAPVVSFLRNTHTRLTIAHALGFLLPTIWLCDCSLLGLWAHWGWGKMVIIFRTIFSNALVWMKIYQFWLICHWRLFVRVQLTIFQHWSVYWCIYVSSRLSELRWDKGCPLGAQNLIPAISCFIVLNLDYYVTWLIFSGQPGFRGGERMQQDQVSRHVDCHIWPTGGQPDIRRGGAVLTCGGSQGRGHAERAYPAASHQRTGCSL